MVNSNCFCRDGEKGGGGEEGNCIEGYVFFLHVFNIFGFICVVDAAVPNHQSCFTLPSVTSYLFVCGYASSARSQFETKQMKELINTEKPCLSVIL